jgi:hypothetical protein
VDEDDGVGRVDGTERGSVRRRCRPPVGCGSEIDARADDVADRPTEAFDGVQRLTQRSGRLRAGVTDVERAASGVIGGRAAHRDRIAAADSAGVPGEQLVSTAVEKAIGRGRHHAAR